MVRVRVRVRFRVKAEDKLAMERCWLGDELTVNHKNGWTDWGLAWDEDSYWPKEHCVRCGSQSTTAWGESAGNFTQCTQRNGWLDHDLVCGGDSCGSKTHCIRWGSPSSMVRGGGFDAAFAKLLWPLGDTLVDQRSYWAGIEVQWYVTTRESPLFCRLWNSLQQGRQHSGSSRQRHVSQSPRRHDKVSKPFHSFHTWCSF